MELKMINALFEKFSSYGRIDYYLLRKSRVKEFGYVYTTRTFQDRVRIAFAYFKNHERTYSRKQNKKL